MKIEVLFWGRLHKLTSRKQTVSLDGDVQLTDLIEYLVKKYGDGSHQETDYIKRLRIMINGREHDLLDGMETHLKDGDVVVFMPIMAGG